MFRFGKCNWELIGEDIYKVECKDRVHFLDTDVLFCPFCGKKIKT